MSLENFANTQEEGVSNQEKVKPIGVKFDNSEPGYPGATIYYSDGTNQWYDARGRRQWEERQDLPDDERLDNLPEVQD